MKTNDQFERTANELRHQELCTGVESACHSDFATALRSLTAGYWRTVRVLRAQMKIMNARTATDAASWKRDDEELKRVKRLLYDAVADHQADIHSEFCGVVCDHLCAELRGRLAVMKGGAK